MIYLLDSDILIDFFHKKPDTVNLVVKLAKDSDLVVSILSVAELRAGWTKSEAEKILPSFYKLFGIKPITIEAAELAGELRGEYKKRGFTLPLIDLLIATTTIVNDAILVTRNKKDYERLKVSLYKF